MNICIGSQYEYDYSGLHCKGENYKNWRKIRIKYCLSNITDRYTCIKLYS